MSTNANETGQGQESTGTNGTQQQGQEPAAGAEAQGQEPNASGQQQNNGGNEFDLSKVQDPEVRAYLEKVQRDAQEARQEAARYRTERNGLQEQVQTYRQESETDQQRQEREATERQERLEALERENRDLKVGQAVAKAAEGAKAHNPATVAGLIQAKVTLDTNGQPTNVAELLTELQRTDPYLFQRGNTDAGDGRESTPNGSSVNDLIRGAVRARRGA